MPMHHTHSYICTHTYIHIYSTIVVFIFACDKFSLFSRFVSNLSADILPPAIRQENLDVLSVEKRDASAKTRARGSYGRLADKQRAQIGKYASKNGNTAAVRRFSKELDRPLSENMVRSIKKNYYQLQRGIYFCV